jgi:cysteine-rich repeat protein
MKRIDPARALLHPIWIASLTLLVLNDHFLKGSGTLPGWMTGKLSDLAGLVVAPVLLAAIVRARTHRAIAIVHAVVGLGFAALELSPSLTAVAGWVYGLAGFSWRSTRDLTDLLALAVLPLSYLFTVRAAAVDRDRLARTTVRLLGTVGLLACTASSGSWVEQQPACGGPDCDFDGYSPPEDCNDADANLNPLNGCPDPYGEAVCDDGADNDFDGLVDCQDIDCAPACVDLDSVCIGYNQWQFEYAGVLSGSTLVGTSVTDGSCVGADSPEVIFEGSASPGVLTFTAPPGHGIHLRERCIDAYTEITCLEGSETGGDVLELTLDAYTDLTVVVEAIDPFQAGPFEVPVVFSPYGCGDGLREDPEQCDDGNIASGDGCSAGCTAELDVLCAALPSVTIGQTAGSFMTATSVFYGECAGSIDSPEQGYRYTAASTSVTVTINSTADLALHAALSCGEMAAPLGCADAVIGSGQETLTLATLPGDNLTFFVELGAGQPADASFTLDITEP